MIKVTVLGLAAVAITVGVVAIIPVSRGKNESSKSKIEAVGLSDYGLEIIDPTNPKFST